MLLLDRIKLQSAVNEFVDEQYGLDCGSGSVMFGGDQIYLYSHGRMSREEWIECGYDLCLKLNIKGFGHYEVSSASVTSCTLSKEVRN